MLTGEPFIPQTITVHLGAPDEDAPNVTVSYPYYIKNVASSEIYPTWEETALRANIYAITSFALNRIYTEWYRARGYDFDITSVTQYDQKYIEGRQIYDNIAVLVDELFDDYVRRQGRIEPLFTAFCNGTTSTCDGLSQWGTVDLARQGFLPYEILQYYYGDDIEIVKNAPVRSATMSYPGNVLRTGDSGMAVQTIQIQLNRISRNYPAIPKIPAASGDFDAATADTVRTFQQVFDLPSTGTVVVTMRVGLVTSLRPYTSPRLQVLPVTSVTSPSTMVTVNWQPKGQLMQVSSLVSVAIAIPPQA